MRTKRKTETRRVTLDPARKKHAQELAELVADGWQILTEHKRGALQWKPGYVDYVLTRER